MIHINSDFFQVVWFQICISQRSDFWSVCLSSPAFYVTSVPWRPKAPTEDTQSGKMYVLLKVFKKILEISEYNIICYPHLLLLLVMCNLREGRIARLCAELAFCEVLLECRSTYIPSYFVHDCLHTCRDLRSHTVRGLQPCSIYYLCSSRK